MTSFASFAQTLHCHARWTGILLLMALLASSGGMSAAHAQADSETDIREMLEGRDQQIKGILAGSSDYTAEQRQELKTLINGVLDFRSMAQTALGPFWDDRTEAERDSFIAVFRDIVRAQSLSDLDVYNSTVTYETIDVSGDSAFVRTMTTYNDARTPVEYVLHRADSTWKAEDIIVDDVSTAEGYARSFQTVVRRHGFDALLQSLERKREAIAARDGTS